MGLGNSELRRVYQARSLDPEALLKTQHVHRSCLCGAPGDDRGRLVRTLRPQDRCNSVDARGRESGGGAEAAPCIGTSAPGSSSTPTAASPSRSSCVRERPVENRTCTARYQWWECSLKHCWAEARPVTLRSIARDTLTGGQRGVGDNR